MSLFISNTRLTLGSKAVFNGRNRNFVQLGMTYPHDVLRGTLGRLGRTYSGQWAVVGERLVAGSGVGGGDFRTRLLRAPFSGRSTCRSLSVPMCGATTCRFSATRTVRRTFYKHATSRTCSQVAGPAIRCFRGHVRAVANTLDIATLGSNVTTVDGVFFALTRTKAGVIASTRLFNGACSFFGDALTTFKIRIHFYSLAGPRTIHTRISRGAYTVFLRIVAGPRLRMTSLGMLSNVTRRVNTPLVTSAAIIPFRVFRTGRFKMSVRVISDAGCVSNKTADLNNLVLSCNAFS